MYPDSGYKLAHAQLVCTRPFSLHWEGPGDEATVEKIASSIQSAAPGRRDQK
jgi:hypothetical protein